MKKLVIVGGILFTASLAFAALQYDGGGYDQSQGGFGALVPPTTCGSPGQALVTDGACLTDWATVALDSNVVHLTGDETIDGTKKFLQTILGDITGNANTCTSLATPRLINGVAFDGTSNITVAAAAGTLTGTTLAPGVVNSSLTSVGTLSSLTVTSPISGSVTGNAATCTALATPRTINGVSFDGTSNITVSADAGTLTGATLAANVLSSSLTSVGTLSALTVSSTINGSISGNAATVTTIPTLSGEVSNTGNSVTLQNASVIGKVLTGYVSGAGTVSATDSILQAIQKLNGNTVANDALYVKLAGTQTVTGAKTFSSVVTANSGINVSGSVVANNDMRFMEAPVNGADYVAFVGPSSVSSPVTWTLPSTDSTGTQALVSDGAGTMSWQTIPGAGITWLLAGNSGTTAGTDFLGTTDAQDVVFKRNGTEVERMISGAVQVTANNLKGTSGSTLFVTGGGTTGALRLAAKDNLAGPFMLLDGSSGIVTLFSSTTQYQQSSGGLIYEANTNGFDLALASANVQKRSNIFSLKLNGGLAGSNSGRIELFGLSNARASEADYFASVHTFGDASGTANLKFKSTGVEFSNGNIFRNNDSTFLRISGGVDNSGGRVTIWGSTGTSDSDSVYVTSNLTRFFDTLGNAEVTFWPSGLMELSAIGTIAKHNDTGSLVLYGGTNGSLSANIILYGSSAGPASEMNLKGSTSTFSNPVSSVTQAIVNDKGIGLGMTPATGSRTIQMLGTATTPTAVAGSGILYVTSAGALRYRGPTTDSLIANP